MVVVSAMPQDHFLRTSGSYGKTKGIRYREAKSTASQGSDGFVETQTHSSALGSCGEVDFGHHRKG
jgi:hypothetical protein